MRELGRRTHPSKAAKGGAPRVYHFGAGVNDNGNVQAIDNCNDTNKTQNFDYDSLNRIAHAWTSGSNWGETYTIDPWGNLTNIDAYAGKTYHENLAAAPASWKNQLNIGGQVIDAAGNLTNDGGGHTYTYDAENRLIATAGWAYVYDADGRRVKKCNACSSASGGTLYWTGAGSDALAESNLGGTLSYEYVFFNGKRVARRDNSGNPPAYYVADHLGSTTILVGSGGSIKNTYEYYPYGGLVSSSETLPQNYKFNGKERDAESNLDEFGARYYASALGRFMIPDWAAKPATVPYANFGNPQSLNLYSYVENNPTTVGDPDGHCGDVRGGECNGGVGGATGAGQGHENGNDTSSSSDKPQTSAQNNSDQQSQTTQSAQTTSQDEWVNPTSGAVRGCDAGGCGNYGAPRNEGLGKTHLGTDYLAEPGQDVKAVHEGTVSGIGNAYRDDSRLQIINIKTPGGLIVGEAYVSPSSGIKAGVKVSAGQVIGTAQDIRVKTGPQVTPHVHVQIRSGTEHINPETLIPVP